VLYHGAISFPLETAVTTVDYACVSCFVLPGLLRLKACWCGLSSVQKVVGTTVFEKFGENRKNSAETHRRRWRNNENREHRNAAGFGDKSAGFTDKPVR
jgi:hypothetical protein